MTKTRHEDPVMQAVRERFESSGLTQQQLGDRMGYPEASARKSVSQFLQSGDPHVSVLRRFAKALGVSLARLLKD